MVSCNTEQDVRDVLARVVRIEGTVQELKNSANASQNITLQMISHVTNQLNSLQLSIQHLHPIIVAPQRLEPDSSSPHLAATSSESHSGEQCPFVTCAPITGRKPCSAAVSLRHMVTCQHCPEGQSRYLSIAEHMLTFPKSPRVSQIDKCCWCGLTFDGILSRSTDNPDARSRHRKQCHLDVIGQLKNSDSHDACVKKLSTTWSSESQSPKKRKLGTSPILPPQFELPFPQGTATKFSGSEENDSDGQLHDMNADAEQQHDSDGEHASNGQQHDFSDWIGNGAV